MNAELFAAPKVQVVNARLNFFDFLLLLCMWLLVFAASIKSIGVWVTYLFLLLSLVLVSRNTYNGILVLLLIAFSPISALVGFPLGIFTTVFMVTAIKYVFADFLFRNKGFNLNPVTVFAAAFVLYLTLTLFYTPVFDLALLYYRKYFEGLIVLLVFFATVDNYQKLGVVLKFWAIAAAFSFFIKWAHFNLGVDTALFQIMKNVDVGSDIDLAGRITITVNDKLVNRFTWPGQEPNISSTDLLFPFGIALGLFSVTKSAGRYLWLLLAVMISIAVIGTYSRSGFISISIVFALFVLGGNKNSLLPSLMLSLVIFAAVMSVPQLQSRILSINDEVVQTGGVGRFDMWLRALQLWWKAPVFGNGLSSFYDHISAHNTYLQILAETGVIGAALYFGIILKTVQFSWRLRYFHASVAKADVGLAKILLFGLGGGLVMMNTITYSDVKLFWLSCAACASTFFIAKKIEKKSRHARLN